MSYVSRYFHKEGILLFRHSRMQKCKTTLCSLNKHTIVCLLIKKINSSLVALKLQMFKFWDIFQSEFIHFIASV